MATEWMLGVVVVVIWWGLVHFKWKRWMQGGYPILTLQHWMHRRPAFSFHVEKQTNYVEI